MNREIKFRAWDKKEKRMLPVDAVNFFNKSIVSNRARGEHSGGQLGFIEVELMQYTGLKDKNGKEIYEGDIIKSGNGALGVVKWRHFGFEQDMIKTLGWWVIQEDGEVIGNIYENPELLE
jgi:uncharacterized phage protein (TIGR01671 family)